jgi:hypothetical protein
VKELGQEKERQTGLASYWIGLLGWAGLGIDDE